MKRTDCWPHLVVFKSVVCSIPRVLSTHSLSANGIIAVSNLVHSIFPAPEYTAHAGLLFLRNP